MGKSPPRKVSNLPIVCVPIICAGDAGVDRDKRSRRRIFRNSRGPQQVKARLPHSGRNIDRFRRGATGRTTQNRSRSQCEHRPPWLDVWKVRRNGKAVGMVMLRLIDQWRDG